MNLIDILNQILNTKLEIKDIVKEGSNDISRYHISIHNYISTLYNEGFAEGYSSKWLELTGTQAYVDEPRSILQYSNVDTYYESYDVDVLTDIMRDVLNYRLLMKGELSTTSDYFPSYPDRLRQILASIRQDGYNAGVTSAQNNYDTGLSSINPPSYFYDGNNIIILSSEYDGAIIQFKFDEDGVWNVYTDRIVITQTEPAIYIRQRYSGLMSPVAGPYSATYNPSGYKPGTGDPSGGGGDTPDNYQPVNNPVITQNQNMISLTGLTTGSSTYVRMSTDEWAGNEWEDWFIYTGNFNITRKCKIEAYSVKGNVYSQHVFKDATLYNIDDSAETGRVATPSITCSNNTVIISCTTSGATIHYQLGDDQTWHTYTGPFQITYSITVSAYADKTGLDNSYFQSQWCKYVDPDDQGSGGGGNNDNPPLSNKPNAPVISCTDNVVTITCSTPGAEIKYQQGAQEGYTTYTEPIVITESTTFNAYAIKDGRYSDTTYYLAKYTKAEPTDPTDPDYGKTKLPMPVIECVENVVTITCADTNATIRYTLGTSGTWSDYSGPIPITYSMTVAAYAKRTDYISSDTTQEWCSYINTDPEKPVEPDPQKPKLSNPSITYSDNIVTITTSEEGTTIRYNVGTSANWYDYDGPFRIYQSCTVAAYSKKDGWKASDTVQEWCVYEGATGGDDEIDPFPTTGKPANPSCTVVDNMVYLTCITPDATIRYTIGGDSNWYDYTGPIPITRDTTIAAYTKKDGKYSDTMSWLCEYIEPIVPYNPDLPTWQDPCEVPEFEVRDDYIYLTCATEGATIWYQIDEGDGSYPNGTWLEYSSPIPFDRDMYLWMYATKDGYSDSWVTVYLFDYVEQPQQTPPPAPTIQYADFDRTCVRITAQYGKVQWKYGYGGDYIETDLTAVNLWPQEKCTIYARAYDWVNDLYSEEVSFNFAGLEHLYSLTPPEITYSNNRFTISNPNSGGIIYYTMDGSNPYDMNHMYQNVSGIGIPYTENVYVRAVVVQLNDDNSTYKSKETTKWCLYDEENIDWATEYFAVKGATAIYLEGNNSGRQTMIYSYDKINWTSFSTSVTGLDSTKWVYLNTAAENGKLWNTMHFGENDTVTMAGNLYTLIENGRRFPETPVRSNIFSGLFEGCNEVVDAQNVYITIANSMNYDLQKLFKNCKNLVYGPRIPNLKNYGRYALYQTFYGCEKLQYVAEMHIEGVAEYTCNETFKDCTSLVSFADMNVTSTIPLYAMASMFENCTSLERASVTVAGDIVGTNALYKMFYGCTNLKNTYSITNLSEEYYIKLISTNLYMKCYESMFENCTSLDKFDILPASILANYCYRFMFKGCSSLVKAPVVSATTQALSAMCSMFEDCVSLEKGPELMTTDLNGMVDCYMKLFKGCTSLNYIRALFLDDISLDNLKTKYTYHWVEDVAEYGTFEQNEDAAWFETGINAIPEKWVTSGAQGRVGRITAIECVYNSVTITADNDDVIFYRINGGDWKLYTGAFECYEECQIEARCQNSRGDFGTIFSKIIKPEIPKPIISQNSDTISITAPEGFNYDVIYFVINNYNWNTGYIPPEYLETYDGPFKIDIDCYVHAYGVRNGFKSEISHYSAVMKPNAPTVTCNNNIVHMSNPNASGRILYKINDTADSIGGWTEYIEDFVITENCTVTAKCGMFGINGESYSDLVTVQCVYDENGASYVLHIPVLKQQENSNLIYLMYDGRVYNNWTNPNIDIKYRIGTTGEWKNYNVPFTIDEDCTIYVYADDGTMQSTVAHYDFTYYSQVDNVDVPTPTYEIVDDDTYDWLHVYNTDGRAVNYYRVDPSATWLYGPAQRIDWINVSSNGTNLYPLGSGKIYVVSTITVGGVRYWSAEVPIDYVNEHDYDENLRAPVIEFSKLNNLVTITPMSPNVITYYSFANDSLHTRYTYSAPFYITSDQTITAWSVSVYDENNKSNYTTKFCDYTLYADITITFAGSSFSLSTTSTDVTLQYSLNGNVWFNYTEPVVLTEDTTVYARAYKDTFTTREYTTPIMEFFDYGGDGGEDSPFTLTALSAGTVKVWLNTPNGYVTAPISVEYSKNNATFQTLNSNNGSISVDVTTGDSVVFRNAKITNKNMPVYYLTIGGTASISAAGNACNFRATQPDLYEQYDGSKYNYQRMFYNATNLVYAENLIISSTNVVNFNKQCYHMFDGCTSLQTSPALPATILTKQCYAGMFKGCVSLETAPELPAETLVEQCYVDMFSGCTSLNYIKCNAVWGVNDYSTYYYTTNWTYGVAASGTFVQNEDMIYWLTDSDDGIPDGWTVVNGESYDTDYPNLQTVTVSELTNSSDGVWGIKVEFSIVEGDWNTTYPILSRRPVYKVYNNLKNSYLGPLETSTGSEPNKVNYYDYLYKWGENNSAGWRSLEGSGTTITPSRRYFTDVIINIMYLTPRNYDYTIYASLIYDVAIPETNGWRSYIAEPVKAVRINNNSTYPITV